MDRLNPYITALDLFIMSVYKPDGELRVEAHETDCFRQLMEIREHVLNDLQEMRKKAISAEADSE